MTDHGNEPPRPLWTDEDLDQALTALHSDEVTGHVDTARATVNDALAHQGVPTLTASRDHDAAPPRPARGRRWGYAAIAAGVAVVAAAAVAFTGPFGHHAPHRKQAAPDKKTVATVPGGGTMRAAATKTIQFGDPKLGPGQYLYVKDVSQNVAIYDPGTYVLGLRVTSKTEKWVPYDQAGTWVQHYAQVGQPKWVIGTPEQIAKHGAKVKRSLTSGHPPTWTEAACGDFYHVNTGGTPHCVQGNEVRKQPNTFLLKKVPQDPKKYLSWAAEGKSVHGADVQQQVMQTSGMLLSSGVIPAKLRATIYSALATLPDLKVTERVANLNGKRGIALGIDGYGYRRELIIDPGNGQYIGMRMTDLSTDEAPAGTVEYLDAMTVAVVDKPRQRP